MGWIFAILEAMSFAKEISDKISFMRSAGRQVLKLFGRTGLEVRFKYKEPYLHDDVQDRFWRIGIKNLGDKTAEDVSVRITAITPRPLDSIFRGDYPIQVERFGRHATEHAPYRISPHDEMIFDFIQSWVSSKGHLIVLGIDTTRDGKPSKIQIQQDETWSVTVTTTSGNAGIKQEVFILRPDNSKLSVYRGNPPDSS